jgi:hypothetical protein
MCVRRTTQKKEEKETVTTSTVLAKRTDAVSKILQHRKKRKRQNKKNGDNVDCARTNVLTLSVGSCLQLRLAQIAAQRKKKENNLKRKTVTT